MSEFTPSKKTASDFNGGVEYIDGQDDATGDAVQAETINNLVESALYTQDVADSAETNANAALATANTASSNATSAVNTATAAQATATAANAKSDEALTAATNALAAVEPDVVFTVEADGLMHYKIIK